MAFELSKLKANERLQKLQTRMKGVVAKADKVVKVAVRSVEVQAGAFGAGLMEGYWGEKATILGMPATLVGYGAGHTVGFFMGSETSDHMHAFSDGVGAAYSCAMGRTIGKKFRDKAKGLLDD